MSHKHHQVFPASLVVTNLVMSLYANASKEAIFATACDNFVYLAVKRIGAKLLFSFNLRVSGRNLIEYANMFEIMQRQHEIWSCWISQAKLHLEELSMFSVLGDKIFLLKPFCQISNPKK